MVFREENFVMFKTNSKDEITHEWIASYSIHTQTLPTVNTNALLLLQSDERVQDEESKQQAS